MASNAQLSVLLLLASATFSSFSSAAPPKRDGGLQPQPRGDHTEVPPAQSSDLPPQPPKDGHFGTDRPPLDHTVAEGSTDLPPLGPKPDNHSAGADPKQQPGSPFGGAGPQPSGGKPRGRRQAGQPPARQGPSGIGNGARAPPQGDHTEVPPAQSSDLPPQPPKDGHFGTDRPPLDHTVAEGSTDLPPLGPKPDNHSAGADPKQQPGSPFGGAGQQPSGGKPRGRRQAGQPPARQGPSGIGNGARAPPQGDHTEVPPAQSSDLPPQPPKDGHFGTDRPPLDHTVAEGSTDLPPLGPKPDNHSAGADPKQQPGSPFGGAGQQPSGGKPRGRRQAGQPPARQGPSGIGNGARAPPQGDHTEVPPAQSSDLPPQPPKDGQLGTDRPPLDHTVAEGVNDRPAAGKPNSGAPGGAPKQQ